MPSHSSERFYDSAVVGSGLVGSLAALVLAEAGHQVALIDKSDPAKRNHASTDRRGIAVAAGSVPLLKRLNLWSSLQKTATPILNIHISHAHRRGSLQYGQRESEGMAMGYIIEGYRLKQAFEEAVSKHPRLHCLMPYSLKSLDQRADHVVFSCHSSDQGDAPQDIKARFCLGADGKNSWVRQHLAMPSKEWSYGQTALVFVVRHEKPHNNIAFEHFLPRGPLALLPLSGHRSSVVWTESNQAATRMLRLSPAEFSDEVSRLFGQTLGSLVLEGSRFSYPLSGQICLNPRQGRCLLIGDAAHSIHPVAGQGFNLGLRDVQWLERQAKALLDPDQTLPHLSSFPRQRVSDVVSMTAMTHGLVKLFSTHRGSLGFLRSLGLSLTEALPSLKKRLTRHAMGV